MASGRKAPLRSIAEATLQGARLQGELAAGSGGGGRSSTLDPSPAQLRWISSGAGCAVAGPSGPVGPNEGFDTTQDNVYVVTWTAGREPSEARDVT